MIFGKNGGSRKAELIRLGLGVLRGGMGGREGDREGGRCIVPAHCGLICVPLETGVR